MYKRFCLMLFFFAFFFFITVTPIMTQCTPGDMDGIPGSIIADFNYLIAYLLECGPEPPCQPVEANGNCELDLGDLLYLAQYLIYGSPYEPVPFCSNPDTYTDPGYPDTISIGTVSATYGETMDVPVYISNDEAIFPVIPLKIDTAYLVCDSVITTGTRGEGIIQGIPRYCEEPTGVLLCPYSGSSPLSSGSGVVAYLRCSIKEEALPGFTEIDSTYLAPNKLRFFKESTFSIKPVFNSGGITIGLWGDANGDREITILDVIYLIHYLFKGGASPIPLEAGDANCDGQVTISDVLFLIKYLFAGGPLPKC
jgi:hypothetical protein